MKKMEYDASGFKNLIHGPMYQVKILFLFLKRALSTGRNFELATEWKPAEKFDDVVFLLQDENMEIRGHFLQAKHKQNERETITYDKLMNSAKGDFSLKMYFNSYLIMKKNLELKDIKMEQFIIFTNIDFDKKSVKSKNFWKQIETPDPILEVNLNNSKKHPTCYHLNPLEEMKEILRGISKAHQLAKELVEHVFSHPPKPLTLQKSIFKEFNKAVCTHIIDTKLKTFRDDFIQEEGSNKEFRDIFLKEVTQHKTLINKDYNCSKVIEDMRNVQKIILRKDFESGEGGDSSELPSDTIDEKDIEDFLRLLVLAVDQPNEEELGEVIEQEVSSLFNVSCGKDIADQVQNQLIDWFKNNKGKFITKETGEEFFQSAERLFSSRLAIGLSAKREEELNKYSEVVQFNDVQLISSLIDDHKCHVISSKEPILTLIKIYQFITQHATYSTKDGHIFIDLTTLLAINIQNTVLNAFKESSSNQLLVIHGNCDEKELNELSSTFSTLRLSFKDANKKLLVVIQKPIDPQTQLLWEGFLVQSDETRFSDLSSQSQTLLLNKRVNFQGNSIKLGELSVDDSHWNGIINGQSILELIQNEELEIGSAPLKLSQSEAAFAKDFSSIKPKNLLKALKLDKKESEKELFLFTKNNENTVNYFDRFSQLLEITSEEFQQLRDNSHVFNNLDIDFANLKKINIILNENENRKFELFKKICYFNTDKCVYWLEIVNGQFNWLQVYDPRFYVERHLSRESIEMDEECLANGGERMVLLVGEGGMGKSTILTHLSEYKLSDSWVFRLDLRDCQQQIKDLPDHYTDPHTPNEIIAKFLLNLGNEHISNQLAVKLLKHSLIHPMKRSLLILFDGYDEISNAWRVKFIPLIKHLEDISNVIVWVSSRREHSKYLEETLGVVSTTFKKLTLNEREEYLRHFYRVRLRLQLSEEEYENVFRKRNGKFNLFFESLLDKFKHMFDESFMGVPLQMRLLAEGFLTEFKQFVECSSVEMVLNFENLDGSQLYQRFINAKYNIYFQEKTKLSIGLSEQSNIWFSNTLNKLHQRVALKYLYPGSIKGLIGGVKPPFLNSQFVMDPKQVWEMMRVGILQATRTQLKFMHKTFAEYFVATYLLECLKKPFYPKLLSSVQYLFENVLQSEPLICMFLNEQIVESDIEITKIGCFDPQIYSNFSPTYVDDSSRGLRTRDSHKKLIRFILSFFKNKIWLLNQCNFAELFDEIIDSSEVTETFKCFLNLTSNYYYVVHNCLLNLSSKPNNLHKRKLLCNDISLLHEAGTNTEKGENVALIIKAIKCYPKIIQHLIRYYDIDDICKILNNENDMCQFVKKLKDDDPDVNHMTPCEQEANRIIKSFVEDRETSESIRFSMKTHVLRHFEFSIIFKNPYENRKLKHLVKILRDTEEIVKKLSGKIIVVEEGEDGPEKLMLKHLLEHFKKLYNSLIRLKLRQFDEINKMDIVLKLMRKRKVTKAEKRLKSLMHIPSKTFWFNMDYKKMVTQILELAINRNQKSIVFFLFDWFKNESIISVHLFFIVFRKYPEYKQKLIDSVDCRETKQLMSHLSDVLRDNLTDEQIKNFGGNLLRAIKNRNFEKLGETLNGMERNPDDIIQWIIEQLPQNETKRELEKYNVLKESLQLLVDQGDLALYYLMEQKNTSHAEQMMNRLKHLPRLFNVLISRFSNGKFTEEMFCFTIEFVWNAFPQMACYLAVLFPLEFRNADLDLIDWYYFFAKDKHVRTLFQIALENNNVKLMQLLFNILKPYPSLLSHLIQIRTKFFKSSLHCAILKSHPNTLEVFLSHLNRNIGVMEHVIDHFITDEEDRLKLFEAAVLNRSDSDRHNRSDSLLLFLNTLKVNPSLIRRFLLPSKGKPALYLAGERGCKEVMDLLLRALKSEAELKWELLTWTDPESGKTVLHRAAERGYVEIADAIMSSVRKQSDKLKTLFSSKDHSGHTSLDCAILSELQIIKNNFNIEQRIRLINSEDYKVFKDSFGDKYSIESLLRLSSALKNIPMVVKLILMFAKSFNSVVLMLAMFENEELSEALVSMNITLHDFSYNLYYSAIHRKSSVLVDQLIAKGIDVNCTNGYGFTPLMKEVLESKSDDIIKSLLKSGANINACNMYGENVYSIANNARNNNFRICMLDFDNN